MDDNMRDVRREIDRLRSTSSAAVVPALVAFEGALSDIERRLVALEERATAAVAMAPVPPVEQAASVTVQSPADSAAKLPAKPARSARPS